MTTKISFITLILLILGLLTACQTTTETVTNTQFVPSVESLTPISIESTLAPKTPASILETPTPTRTQPPMAPLDGVVAFYSDRDGNPEIYMMNLSDGSLARLTNDPASDDSPAISPDGKQIVFLTARNDPDPHFPDFKYEIYMMDIDGGNLRRLTNTEGAEDHPAWSPDGSKILFDADYDEDGFYEIYSMNSDGTDVTRLTSTDANDQFADWSPDGSQIAFSSDRDGNWELYVMDADGKNQRRLASIPDWELFPAWSPDGSQIAFNRLQPNSRNTDIYVMAADGSQVRKLTEAPGFDENPAWAPDGAQILFQSNRDGNFELYIMNADGSEQRAFAPSSANVLWPSWRRAAALAGSMPPPLFVRSSQELGLSETFQAGLGDLDGDGDLDAVFANPMRNNAEVWLNDGTGVLINTGQELTQYGHGVGLADFDSDNDLDAFLVCHQFFNPSRIYFNDGSGLFLDTGQDLDDTRMSAVDINLLDINGDGHQDAHVIYFDAAGMPDQVYLNDGTGIFKDSGLRLDEDTIAWGDLDGDGDDDYFGKRWGEGYVVMLNSGSGKFTPGWQMAFDQATVGDIGLADFDNDGDLDALVTNGFRDTGSQPSRLLWNQGDSQFSDSGETINETMGSQLAIGDLDLDGDLDVFVTNMDRPNEVWLYENGRFVDSGLRLGSDSDLSGRPTLGDLDGDGDLDVVIGRFRGGAEIYFNTTVSKNGS